MPTKTASVLAELEQLEQARDQAHADARTAREPLTKWEREHFGLPATQKPAELESAWLEAVDRYHQHDIAVRRFKVDNARALLAESLPDRDQVGARIVEGVRELLADIAGYTGLEHRTLEVLARVGLSGADMVSDPQVARLAKALEPFEDLEEIHAPYSRSAETPEGHLPLFRPNEDRTGWISWNAVS